jgi:hypothetical protein
MLSCSGTWTFLLSIHGRGPKRGSGVQCAHVQVAVRHKPIFLLCSQPDGMLRVQARHGAARNGSLLSARSLRECISAIAVSVITHCQRVCMHCVSHMLAQGRQTAPPTCSAQCVGSKLLLELTPPRCRIYPNYTCTLPTRRLTPSTMDWALIPANRTRSPMTPTTKM